MTSSEHLAAIRARDAQTPASWFSDEIAPNLIAIAVQDRRALLAEIDRLEGELAAAQVAPLVDLGKIDEVTRR